MGKSCRKGKEMKRKTGQRPMVRQPLKIDRLPVEMQERIKGLRTAGRTWAQIEEASMKFPEWDGVPPEVQTLFPNRRLPGRTLLRWWDLRVEQVRNEAMRQAIVAKVIIDGFASARLGDLPAPILNELRDLVLSVIDHKGQFELIKRLNDLGRSLLKNGENRIHGGGV